MPECGGRRSLWQAPTGARSVLDSVTEITVGVPGLTKWHTLALARAVDTNSPTSCFTTGSTIAATHIATVAVRRLCLDGTRRALPGCPTSRSNVYHRRLNHIFTLASVVGTLRPKRSLGARVVMIRYRLFWRQRGSKLMRPAVSKAGDGSETGAACTVSLSTAAALVTLGCDALRQARCARSCPKYGFGAIGVTGQRGNQRFPSESHKREKTGTCMACRSWSCRLLGQELFVP